MSPDVKNHYFVLFMSILLVILMTNIQISLASRSASDSAVDDAQEAPSNSNLQAQIWALETRVGDLEITVVDLQKVVATRSASTVAAITPTPAPQQSKTVTCAIPANGSPLNIRSGPSTQYPAVATASPGVAYTVVGRNADLGPAYVWVLLEGTNRWLAGWLMDCPPEVDTVPNVSAPPVPSARSAPELDAQPIPTQAQPQTPEAAVTSLCPGGCSDPVPGCVIKGNISISSGSKIYHKPGQEFYDNVTISPQYDERWFCTEAEAQAAGWRPSSR